MKIVKWLLIILLSIVIVAIGFVLTLTIFEYKPDDVEDLAIEDNQTQTITIGDSLTALTFNMGYAGLGEDEDFVMDGGTKGRPDSKDVVEEYFNGIKQILSNYPSDFYMLQEVDLRARRSYEINEVVGISEHLGDDYSIQFAYNFKAMFVPFPLSLTDYIGYVESGIATYTNYHVESSTRYQFPGSFSWPLRVANLKRAMMVSEMEIEGSTKKLMVVNLHMSAYDGDGSLRTQEMAFLKAFLEEQETLGNYVLIGGDFNQTFPDAVGIYDQIPGLYEAFPIENDFLPNGYSFMVDLTLPSCRLLNQPYDPDSELTQYYIIDGFIVSSNIEVEAYSVLDMMPGAKTLDMDFAFSDHNPVVLRFKLVD